MDISVIVPLFNEEESLPELTEWIDRVMKSNNFSYEVILVDDGSSDTSWKIINEISAKNKAIKGIKFRINYGKSAALHTGFSEAKGDVVITMDADLQDSPDEIPELYRMIKSEDFDLVSGWKKKRYDPISKTIPSKLFNRTARALTGIKLHDFNCGLKAYKNEVVKNIEVYGEMHRYIPVIAKKAGYKKIGEKIVQHQERKYGITKFGIDRFIKGYLDLLSITFITKFGQRPMHLFGTLGTLMFIVGFLSAAWLGAKKIYFISQGIPADLVTKSPYFFLALTSMIIGTQLFLTGFLGEMISRTSSNRNNYLIEAKNNL
ncbi:MAG: glycosyl transferase family 2 [Bacteroidetes bacterium GWF2_33_16]|nr:MAG: glycosyl transferase family 2 [Bacteroidetes bacterium GWE2_32_14]OFY06619.1 MAG: glycosyl transferase family 2 [Bacteroidetes bacterium GWF2_33_16]